MYVRQDVPHSGSVTENIFEWSSFVPRRRRSRFLHPNGNSARSTSTGPSLRLFIAVLPFRPHIPTETKLEPYRSLAAQPPSKKTRPPHPHRSSPSPSICLLLLVQCVLFRLVAPIQSYRRVYLAALRYCSTSSRLLDLDISKHGSQRQTTGR
jgi:hypothetical protein